MYFVWCKSPVGVTDRLSGRLFRLEGWSVDGAEAATNGGLRRPRYDIVADGDGGQDAAGSQQDCAGDHGYAEAGGKGLGALVIVTGDPGDKRQDRDRKQADGAGDG